MTIGQAIYPDGKVRATRATDSAHHHETVTPSDTVGFTGTSSHGPVATGIYVGVGGDISCVVNSVTKVYKNVPTGSILPVEASRVNFTGTTAADMLALF